jgi:thiamine biosynthesis lipoprotein
MDHVHVDEAAGTAWFDRPGVSLDLGAIGKGYAVDAVARLARKHGVPLGAVTSGRSSVLTWGIPPGEDGWRFEVVHPDEPGDALARLEVEPGAMSSSSASERRFFQGGSEYGHVIDPRTGRPARASRSATAWTRTAVLGDVLTTAVYVAGKEALSPGGAAEKLAAAWCEPGEEPRASVLLVEEDPGTWGGLRTESWFVGRQGWKAERIP